MTEGEGEGVKRASAEKANFINCFVIGSFEILKFEFGSNKVKMPFVKVSVHCKS